MAPPPVTFVILISMVMMTFLYGLYVVMFVLSMHYFSRKKGSRMTRANKLIVLAAVLLFLVATVQWIFVVIQALSPFTSESSGNASQTDAAFLAGVSGSANIANLSLFGCELVISDIVMIYRLWIVTQHNRYLVAPTVCLFIGSIVMLSYKIWESQKALRQAGTHLSAFSVSRMLAVIIESAALYTASTFSLLVTYACGSIGSWIVQDMAAPIAGIAYSLIIIRFGRGGAFRRNGQLTTTITVLPSSQPSSSGSSNHIALKPMNVRIHVDRETDEINAEDTIINIDDKVSSTV
ncbi:hypothetical protein PHLGIDRAFT_119539 [Phlebiopsis gigantea 11061_1 CR5-6]|uniref:Uncharacterized protein n=1 Tax=Phlebiopsis gigantea (strain 11061_1 CR5-6) TaxID=745531 RepID=A0A0C3PIE8_PHLG1|nr:hypothetical protein PHLGIDRAFT_119539 [Phlebiopsis gigantea 11061_1 CR5-6]